MHPLSDSVGLRRGERKALQMTGDTPTRAASAHVYPLTIRELLLTGVRRAPDQQIVYADKRRLTFSTSSNVDAELDVACCVSPM